MVDYNRDEVEFVAVGRHASPRSGGSLLELSSTLRDREWTAFPDFLPYSLRSAVEEVCWHTSAAGRTRLAFAVPWIAGLPACSEESATASVSRAFVAMSLSTPEQEGGFADIIRRHGCSRSSGRGWLREIMAHRAVASAIRAATLDVARRGGDTALRALLVDIIDIVRAGTSLPPINAQGPPDEHATVCLPVKSRLQFLGGDEVRLEAIAIVEEWPQWLRKPWQVVSSEMAEREIT